MIKRPIMLLAASYVVGIILHDKMLFLLLIFIMMLIGVTMINGELKVRNKILWLCPILLLLGALLSEQYSKRPSFERYVNAFTDVEAVGLIDSISVKENSIAVIITKSQVKINDNKIDSGKILVYLDKAKIFDMEEYRLIELTRKLTIGNTIKVKGEIQKFEFPGNPGQFDEYKYYVEGLNYDYKMYGKEFTTISNKECIINKAYYFLKNRLLYVKIRCKTIFENTFYEEADVMCAMLLGDKSVLDEKTKNLYMKNGISHILAISGVHITLIGMGIYEILKRLRLNIYTSSIISIILIVLYGIMTDFSTSTCRAVIMLVAMIIGRMIGKTYDSLNMLSISALIILIINPYQLYQTGFLLSFFAVLAIILINPYLTKCTIKSITLVNNTKKLKIEKETGEILDDRYLFNFSDVLSKIFRHIQDFIIAGISVYILTVPILLYTFFEVPIISLFLNIIVIPLMGLVLGLGICACIAGIISTGIAAFFAGGAYYILKLYNLLCLMGDEVDWNVITVGRPAKFTIIIYYIVVAVFYITAYIRSKKSSYIYRNIKNKYIFVLFRFIRKNKINAAYILLLCLIIFIKVPYKDEIVMLDVGQGQCIYARANDGTTFLYDCGSSDVTELGKYRIIPFLKYKGIKKVDYLIISHMDNDHISAYEELLNEECDIRINKVVLPKVEYNNKAYQEIVAASNNNKSKVSYISKGNKLSNSNWSINCIHPHEGYKYTSENAYSTTLLLSIDKFDILLTGDIESDGESEIVNKKLVNNIEVLQVAHHGSKYSSSNEFVQYINPDYALISAGLNNRYGHPNQETLDRFNQADVKVLSTINNGAIIININKDEYTIKGYR